MFEYFVLHFLCTKVFTNTFSELEKQFRICDKNKFFNFKSKILYGHIIYYKT